MNICDIITKKRDGLKLSLEEIEFAVDQFVLGSVADHQMSAFLMAVCIRGMDDHETSDLCGAMINSGKVMDLSSVRPPKIDKHSTGGVGDGTSLVVAPLCACCGIAVPMMSGRSLGHTGGTLDKLESIPGFNVNIKESMFKKQLASIGAAMIGQSASMVPADKKLYALRDVTATVDSIPLIAASIMSKKIAEGADGILLDVKTGNGAFMTDAKSARALGKAMIAIGKAHGRKMSAVITGMDQPLGNAVGNALEVTQAVETMRGEGPKDFTELCVDLSARMLLMGKAEKNLAAAKERLYKCIDDGRALSKFEDIVRLQGGNARVARCPEKVLPKARFKENITSAVSGWITAFDTRCVGIAANEIGAGRKTQSARIDHSAGFIINRKIGDMVEKGETLAVMYYNDCKTAANAVSMFASAVSISSKKAQARKLIREELI